MEDSVAARKRSDSRPTRPAARSRKGEHSGGGVDANDIRLWINELPLPAFCIQTGVVAIHSNAALNDFLATADPANIYADVRSAKTLLTFFPNLAELARRALQTGRAVREAYQWPLTGEVCLMPVSPRDAGIAIGFIDQHRCEQRLAQKLKRRMRLVRMLSDIAARAITIEDLPTFLDECMWLMGTTIDIGGVCFWTYDADHNTFSNTSEWIQAGVASHKAQHQKIPAESAPGFAEALQNQQVLVFSDTRDIDEPAVRDVVAKLGIQSLLIIPLLIANELYGFMGFEEYQRRRQWSPEAVAVLKSVAAILTRVIENKFVEKDLDAYRADLESKIRQRTVLLEETNAALVREIETRRRIAEDLAQKSRSLEEANTALRVLLKQVQSERHEAQEMACQNLKELIGPKIAALSSSGLKPRQRDLLKLIEANLKGLLQPGVCSLSDQLRRLTPNELNVADMIRQGITSREIADLLSISIRTVEVYRYSIRKNLGLTNRKINLRTYLLSTMPPATV